MCDFFLFPNCQHLFHTYTEKKKIIQVFRVIILQWFFPLDNLEISVHKSLVDRSSIADFLLLQADRNWIKLRGVWRKINTPIPSLLNIFLNIEFEWAYYS